MVFLAVLSVCFFKVPSFRVYRKRRNLIIYAVSALILGLLAYQAYDSFLGPAYVSYSLENGETRFYAGRVNTLSVSSSNMGMRTASFNLILKSVNASFTPNTQQNYVQVNSTIIKVPFSFPQGGRETKPVQFTIDENVSAFAFYTSTDMGNGDAHFSVYFVLHAESVWDSKTSSFTLTPVPTPVF